MRFTQFFACLSCLATTTFGDATQKNMTSISDAVASQNVRPGVPGLVFLQVVSWAGRES